MVQVTLLYTAPTAIRALQSFGDKFVTQHSRKTLRILGTVGEPINPEAWKWYHEVRRSSPPQLPCLRGALAGLGIPKQGTGQCAQPCVPGALQAAPLGVPLSSEGLPNICMEERAMRAALPDCKCSSWTLPALGSSARALTPGGCAAQVVGEGRCPIVDTWWQTETGAHMITPLPGATTLKPGSATLPFFGVEPAVLSEKGEEMEGECEGWASRPSDLPPFA